MLKVLIIISLCLLFWLLCFLNTGNDQKNILGFRTYPKEVQELVRKDPVLGKTVPLEINMIKVFFSNYIVFVIIFLVVGILLKYTVHFNGFRDAFIFFLIMGETLNVFDLIVIDLLWWRNSPRIRFSCVPDKKLYQDLSKHIASFVRAIFMYLMVAVTVAIILTILP